MQPFTLALLAALAVAGPVSAQNPQQIQRSMTASCPGCNLFQADYTNRQMKARDYSRARLRQANMSAAIMNGTNFSGADLRDVNAYGGLFTSANFSGADLTNASFVGAYLQGANFRGANLAGANFAGAEMNRATGLTQAQLNAACGDAATQLPRGLRLPAC
jgi:uncharacterized protein YjbI with pentapeptide repeats